MSNVLDLRGNRELVSREKMIEMLNSKIKNNDIHYHNLILSTKSYSPEAISLLADRIKSFNSLYAVDGSDIISGIPSHEAQKTIKILLDSMVGKGIKSLNLSDNALGPEGIMSMENFLSKASYLEELYLCNDGLSGGAIKILCNIMNKYSYPHLKKLHFFNNMSGDEGAIALSKLIPKLVALEDFRWASTRTTSEGGKLLVESLMDLKYIKCLDISDNSFNDITGGLIRDLVRTHKIQKLVVGDTNLDNIQKIIESLQYSVDVLETLDLSYNNIDTETMVDLCNLLSICTNLKHLNISHNNFGNVGLKILIKLLKSRKMVKSLVISHNELSSQYVLELLHNINIQDLDYLNVDGNLLTDECIDELRTTLRTKLGSLDENEDDDNDCNDFDNDEYLNLVSRIKF